MNQASPSDKQATAQSSSKKSGSFHDKVLIGYVLVNVILIAFEMLNLKAPDPATASDQDMVEYGVAKGLGPIVIMLLTGVVVMLLYLIRGLAIFTQRLIKKVTK